MKNEPQAEPSSASPAPAKKDDRCRDNLTPEQRSAIGRMGGKSIARNSAYMAEIGRKGGVAVSKDREHMAQIGQKGGRC